MAAALDEMAEDLQMTSGGVGEEGRPHGLRVNLLGSMSVEFDGRALHVAGPQRRRMLALLACRAGRAVSVDALADAMWGDDPPPSAAKTVQSHVVRLRQSLAGAGDPIETTAGGYRLSIEPSSTDIVIFDQMATLGSTELRLGHASEAAKLLESALALWRGPALMEFTADDFTLGERTRLEERRFVAVEDLAEARLELGQAAGVVPDLERLLAEEPGRERLWVLLMRALYASGRQREALAAYQRARALLGEHFGLAPGRELRELEQRILDQDPALLGRDARPTLPPALRSDTVMFGRENELAWFEAAWRRACSGVGQVRALLGAVGSGRTRLIAELSSIVLADGGVVEYVQGAIGLHTVGDVSGPGSVVDAITRRCQTASMLLIVDDVEWTPLRSVEATHAVASAAERLTILVVIIGHDGDGPGIQLIHELERSCSTTLSLAPLSDRELSDMLEADGIEQDAIDAAIAIADGLPARARQEAAAWSERAATDRLNKAARTSIGARSAANVASTSVLEEVARLIEARARRAALAGAESVGRQPYRSLASYEAADADLFVGRERVVAELTARMLDRRMIAVVGASGSGKSSIVRAGLLPLVRSGRLPGGVEWRTNVIVPGHAPLREIDAVPGLYEPGPQLLVIDQFEELLATGDVDSVAGQLLDVMLDPTLDAHIVVVIRVDQIGALASSPALRDMIEENQVLVGPPTGEELRRILSEPAARTGCKVEPELVSRVAADVAGHDAALPLVSAAMAEVWERRVSDTLLLSSYLEIGGLAAAVKRLGDRALLAVGESGFSAVRDVMRRLVDVTDDGAWTRRRVPFGDLPSALTPAVAALMDARLVVRTGDDLDVVHEVVFRAWPQMVAWLEEARRDITLERDLRASARSWDTEGRSDDDVLRGSRLVAANDWAARRDDVAEPVAALIAASRAWARRDDRALCEQLAQEHRSRRRLAIALISASVLLVIAVVGGGLAIRNSRRAEAQRSRADAAAAQADAAAEQAENEATNASVAADRAESLADEAEAAADLAELRRAEAQTSRLVAESRNNLDRDLSLAMLLAVEAYRNADTPATRGALLSALTHNISSVRTPQNTFGVDADVPHVKSSFLGFVAGPARQTHSMSVSNDGRIVATGGLREIGDELGSAIIFDTTRRQIIGTIDTTVAPRVSVSPDGTSVLVTDATQVLRFDVAALSSDELNISRNGSEFLLSAYTLDGSRFLVSTSDHHLRLFDASTFGAIDIDLPESPDNLAEIEPDGSLGIGRIAPPAVTFWDLDNSRELRTVPLEFPPNPVNNFAHSGDGAWLAAFPYQGPLVVWDLSDGKLAGAPAIRPQSVRAVAFDPSNPAITAIGSADGSVTMYDVVTDRPIGRPLRGMLGGVRALAFSGDGQLLVTTGDDGALALWTDNGGPSLLSSPMGDGEHLLDASENGDVLVLGGPRAAEIVRPAAPTASIRIDLDPLLPNASEFAPMVWMLTPEGSRLLGGLASSDSSHIWLFDTATGDLLWTHTEAASLFVADVSADGARVSMTIGDSVSIWDVRTDAQIASFTINEAVTDVAAFFTGPPLFNADGTNVAITTNVGVVRFDIETASLAYGDAGGFVQGWVSQITGTDDLVAAGLGGRLLRLDMATGTIIASGRSFDGTSLVRSVISADGSLIAAAHPFTSSIALVDSETMVPVGDPVPAGDVGDFSPLVMAPDGKRLYANGPLNNATEWNLDPLTWRSIACRAAGRNLSVDEWTAYIGFDVPYERTCEQWPPRS